jgi:predicted transcriptional regulator
MAIDFACNTVSVNELLTCSFSLTKGELNILNLFLRENNALTIKEISSRLNMERSGAQKAVKRLVEINLLEKRQINNQRGGFFYRYYLADKDSIRKRIEELIESWTVKAKETVQNL